MPYIKPEYREVLEKPLDDLWGTLMYIPGEDLAGVLTYIIYYLFINMPGKRYREFAALLGILDSVGKEFYRRVIAPYEDEKIQQNGDVK